MKNEPYPIVKAQMLIRVPVNEVFEAMTNPAITSAFWFTKSSGRVEANTTLVWEWGWFGVKDTVKILDVTSGKHISLQWNLGDLTTHVEMFFEERSANTTLIRVTEKNFWSDEPKDDPKLDEKITLMLGQNGGWNLVLANLKAWLEHGIQLNLIADQNPDHVIQSAQ